MLMTAQWDVPQPIDRYASPEALSRVASAPLSICQLIFFVTEGDRQHIALLRKDHRGDEITCQERYAITWVARQFTHCSFPQIGRALACDHSAIIRGYNRAIVLRAGSREFRALTDSLVEKLRPRVQKSVRRLAKSVGGRR